jgi:hypothetical protein
MAGKGVILKMDATKVPSYVKYNNTRPAFYSKVGGDTESEILLPPGKIKLGSITNKVVKISHGFSGLKNIPYTEIDAVNYT